VDGAGSLGGSVTEREWLEGLSEEQRALVEDEWDRGLGEVDGGEDAADAVWTAAGGRETIWATTDDLRPVPLDEEDYRDDDD